jgi:hypothetical protein
VTHWMVASFMVVATSTPLIQVCETAAGMKLRRNTKKIITGKTTCFQDMHMPYAVRLKERGGRALTENEVMNCAIYLALGVPARGRRCSSSRQKKLPISQEGTGCNTGGQRRRTFSSHAAFFGLTPSSLIDARAWLHSLLKSFAMLWGSAALQRLIRIPPSAAERPRPSAACATCPVTAPQPFSGISKLAGELFWETSSPPHWRK